MSEKKKESESSILQLTREILSPQDLIFGEPLSTERAEQIFDTIFASAVRHGEKFIIRHFLVPFRKFLKDRLC